MLVPLPRFYLLLFPSTILPADVWHSDGVSATGHSGKLSDGHGGLVNSLLRAPTTGLSLAE